MKNDRLNQYRVMWVMVFFDLPVETKKDQRNYRKFVNVLEKDGFTRFQFSVFHEKMHIIASSTQQTSMFCLSARIEIFLICVYSPFG